MDRETFLQHISDQLGRPRQRSLPQRDLSGVPSFYREQPLGETGDTAPVERFRAELTSLGGDVRVIDHVRHVEEVLLQFIAETEPQTIVTWDRATFDGWAVDGLWDLATVYAHPAAKDFTAIAAEADIGITTVDYAIANTGTVVLRTTDKQPRSVSLLPTTHVVLIRESQIVARMGEAFGSLQTNEGREGIPSSVHFISGPSRSSDIENDLSIGVHGPVAVKAIVARGV